MTASRLSCCGCFSSCCSISVSLSFPC